MYITFINQQTHHFAAHRKRLLSIPEDVLSENTESLIVMQNSNTEQSIDIIVDRCDSEKFVEFSYGEDQGPQSNKLLVP